MPTSKALYIRDLRGLGPKSEQMLAAIGITDVAEFLSADAFEIYRQLAQQQQFKNLNMLYAMLGAQSNQHWQEIARSRKTEILIRLDDMGLAPK